MEIMKLVYWVFGKLLPDLAVVADEIWYLIWNRELEVTIHNVGTAMARQITITFYEETGSQDSTTSPNHIAQVTVPYLSWPMDLEAKSITLSSRYLPKRSDVSLPWLWTKTTKYRNSTNATIPLHADFTLTWLSLTCQEGRQARLAVMSPSKSGAAGFNCSWHG